MARRMKQGLTYANVMATVAVFVALSGGAYAAGVVPFAKNAGRVGDIQASRTPKAGRLLALDSHRRFPASVLPASAAGRAGDAGPAGSAGPQGAPGKDGAPGPQGPAGKDGVNGTKGANGTNGTNGKDAGAIVAGHVKGVAHVNGGLNIASPIGVSSSANSYASAPVMLTPAGSPITARDLSARLVDPAVGATRPAAGAGLRVRLEIAGGTVFLSCTIAAGTSTCTSASDTATIPPSSDVLLVLSCTSNATCTDNDSELDFGWRTTAAGA